MFSLLTSYSLIVLHRHFCLGFDETLSTMVSRKMILLGRECKCRFKEKVEMSLTVTLWNGVVVMLFYNVKNMIALRQPLEVLDLVYMIFFLSCNGRYVLRKCEKWSRLVTLKTTYRSWTSIFNYYYYFFLEMKEERNQVNHCGCFCKLVLRYLYCVLVNKCTGRCNKLAFCKWNEDAIGFVVCFSFSYMNNQTSLW